MKGKTVLFYGWGIAEFPSQKNTFAGLITIYAELLCVFVDQPSIEGVCEKKLFFISEPKGFFYVSSATEEEVKAVLCKLYPSDEPSF